MEPCLDFGVKDGVKGNGRLLYSLFDLYRKPLGLGWLHYAFKVSSPPIRHILCEEDKVMGVLKKPYNGYPGEPESFDWRQIKTDAASPCTKHAETFRILTQNNGSNLR
jgi:hypothetical protein